VPAECRRGSVPEVFSQVENIKEVLLIYNPVGIIYAFATRFTVKTAMSDANGKR